MRSLIILLLPALVSCYGAKQVTVDPGLTSGAKNYVPVLRHDAVQLANFYKIELSPSYINESGGQIKANAFRKIDTNRVESFRFIRLQHINGDTVWVERRSSIFTETRSDTKLAKVLTDSEKEGVTKAHKLVFKDYPETSELRRTNSVSDFRIKTSDGVWKLNRREDPAKGIERELSNGKEKILIRPIYRKDIGGKYHLGLAFYSGEKRIAALQSSYGKPQLWIDSTLDIKNEILVSALAVAAWRHMF